MHILLLYEVVMGIKEYTKQLFPKRKQRTCHNSPRFMAYFEENFRKKEEERKKKKERNYRAKI